MPSANISTGFNAPLVPGQYFEYDISQANKSLPGALSSIVLLGQRTVAGTLPALQLTTLVASDQAAALFGNGSVLHLMAVAALAANPTATLSAIALDDAAGAVAASATITITGAATASASLSIKIANADPITIAVFTGDTAAVTAAALAARLAQLPDLPVIAAVAAGVITLTAKNKGTLGNGIKVAQLGAAPGLTLVITAMVGGATDPLLQPALTAILPAGHDIIASAWSDTTSLTTLRTHLDLVNGPIEQRDAVATYGQTGAYAATATLAATLNHGWMYSAWCRATDSLPYEVAAALAAVIGSEPDPVRPLNTLPLTSIDPPDIKDRYLSNEKNLALKTGITPLEVGPGERVQIVRVVSTRTLDARGNPSQTLLDITTVRGLAAVRKGVRQRLAERFPRDKGSKRNLKKVRSELLNVLLEMERAEWVQNIEQHKAEIIIERDLATQGQFNARIPAPIVPGLHVLAGQIVLYL